MCQSHDGGAESTPTPTSRDENAEPFPWHLGAVDAHCHPTDTMASVASIPSMKTRAITIMATRAQDQNLVSDVAASQTLHRKRPADTLKPSFCEVVPSYGWHPWFSHQLFDDSAENPTYTNSGDAAETPTYTNSDDRHAAKAAHYAAVLAPPPTDHGFLAALPRPIPLSSFINATRNRLLTYPLALIGEVGVDRAFRLPQPWASDLPPSTSTAAAADEESNLTPGGRQGRPLSPHRVTAAHQRAVLEAQLRLAGEMGRAVSVHGVQAHGALYEAVSATWKGCEKEVISRRARRLVAPGAEDISESDSEQEEPAPIKTETKPQRLPGRPFPPRICLHSYSGGTQMLTQWLNPAVPSDLFFSFSSAVNMGSDSGRARLAEVVAAVPDDRILAESDLHIAGDEMDDALEEIYRELCKIKGWALEEGVRRIGKNYERFVFGT